MKKMMFNGAYGLTDAVLHGIKTQTRRFLSKVTYGDLTIEQNPLRLDEHRYGVNSHSIKSNFPKYKVGEVIAVTQSYGEIAAEMMIGSYDYDLYEKFRQNAMGMELAGNLNKMFVRADLMPHHIQITGIRCERLQDISDEDCIKEGIYRLDSANGSGGIAYSFVGASDKKHIGLYDTPCEAFSALIDKVSGKGTWERNPFVWVYEFELIN